MADPHTPPQLAELVIKWRKEAAEIDDDGDFCCALMRRHDADELAVALTGGPAPLPQEEGGYANAGEAALDACRAVLHWYESDSSEYNREMAIHACRRALAQAEKVGVGWAPPAPEPK